MSESPGQSKEKPGNQSRWAGLDNLRSWIVFLVVVMHSNVTYSGIGGWYYTETTPESLDIGSKIWFGFYGSFVQAWFMGTLFFLAGFFAHRSLEKKGAGRFLTERFEKLGLPLIFFVFALSPLIRVELGRPFSWLTFLGSGSFLGATGPLWFAEALLVFSALFVAWRLWRPIRSPRKVEGFTLLPALGWVSVVGLGAFLLRQLWPMGTAVANLQFGYFSTYIGLFALGIHGGRTGWFERLTKARSRTWLWLGVLGAPILWGLVIGTSGAMADPKILSGGWNWPTAAYGLWEAFTSLAMTLGLAGLALNRTRPQGRLGAFLAERSFGVFVLHAPVLVGLSLGLSAWSAPMLLKHLVVAPLAWLTTLALVSVLRLIPGLKKWTS